MLGLLGKKIGMTTIFTEEGTEQPVTVIQAGPCTVIQVKTNERDGYSSIQLGYDSIPPKLVNKPMTGHFKNAGVKPFRKLREFRLEELSKDLTPGKVLKVEDVFSEGDKINLTGTSKGKGFSGVVKRYNFKGGPKSHGQKDKHRSAGSIGASSIPSRVFKGLKMPGHQGNKTITIKGLRILKIIPEDNLILVKGSVAGPRGSYLVIKKQFS